MTGAILSYQQEDSVKLRCEINLKKLYPDSARKERKRFDNNWKNFLKSPKLDNEIFELKGDLLKYQSEQLILKENNNKPPLLFVLGNPASHSVKEGMFFSFEGDKKEHRFWNRILDPAGVLKLSYNENLTVDELNAHRKDQLLNLDYKSPFRIGLCVLISMPSKSSGPWSGVAGVQRLIGAKAMRLLEVEETRRVIECAKKFLTPKGAVVTFQKNAWNSLKSDGDVSYSIDNAKNGKLKGTLKNMPNIPLIGVPPTRLSGPCSSVLRKLLTQRRYKLLPK